MIKAILTDIEGTVGSVSFVKDVLFPFAKKRLPSFVASHGAEPQVSRILDEARRLAQQPLCSNEEIGETLVRWIDEDRKATPLKDLQGLIWAEGYRDGRLRGHLYRDAYDHLRRWREQGLSLFVYSSGSVQAQKLYFEHSVFGNIGYLFKNFFDTNAGHKRDASSYRRISAMIGASPGQILYLSDTEAELAAAREAGYRTYWLVREGFAGESAHPKAEHFGAVDLD